jgi:superfamily II DNA or RNA helicase
VHDKAIRGHSFMRMVFDRGTLVLHGDLKDPEGLPGILWDPRVKAWRAPACYYRDLSSELQLKGVTFQDEVRAGREASPSITQPELRPYQAAAITAWEVSGRRGIITLPTGSGKTRVAIAAMARSRFRALCLVPTRVLMAQWIKNLSEVAGKPIGEYGDGNRIEQPITVATFASAFRNMETLGNRFDLLVVDEVHHFGSGAGDEALEMCIAPARLGLSATLPEDETRRARLNALIGPEIYRASIEELAGRYLASFRLITISVGLAKSERQAYDADMSLFRPVCRTFFKSAPEASWTDFIGSASRSDAGRRAIAAWRHSHAIVRYTQEKRNLVHDLLLRHRNSRILVFAADNNTAYEVAREHLVQPITCDIGPRERTQALQCFSKGELRILVSARVLNEGIDVPAADIAIMAGGSRGSLEYIQRVGRVLRPSEGKQAIVYDLVTRGTFEEPRADKHRRALVAG